MGVNRGAELRATISPMKTHTSTHRGFTLVELLVVISIIAILTGIIVTNLTSSRAKARDAKRVSDLGQIQLAIELYYDRCKQYPPMPLAPDTTTCTVSGKTVPLTDYLKAVPTPPTTATPYEYFPNDNHNDYVLHVTLEGYNEVLKDSGKVPTTGNWTGLGSLTCDTTLFNYCLRP